APGHAPVTVPGLDLGLAGSAAAGVHDLGSVVLAPGVRLEGRVVDGEGTGVAGASVWLDEGGGVFDRTFADRARRGEAATDAQGRFAYDGLPESRQMTLYVRADGYATARIEGVVAVEGSPLEVVLEAVGRVTGKVVDSATGAPLAGAQVASSEGMVPVRRLLYGGQATTGADGRFELEQVAKGSFDLAVAAEGYRLFRRAGLEMAAGGEVRDLLVELEKGSVLTGTVRGAGGLPVVSALVSASRESESRGIPNRFPVETDARGRYRLDFLEPGSWEVSVLAEGYLPGRGSVRLEPGSTALDFELESGTRVSGRVIDDATLAPLAGVRIHLLGQGESASAVSRAGGDFEVEGVAPGQYRLQAEAAGYSLVDPEESFEVAEIPVAGLEVRLATGARVEGRVLGLSFEQLSRLQIYAWGPGASRMGSVSYDGSYHLDGLGPGSWTVRADVSGTGRQAQRTVAVEEGSRRIELDLDFELGYTLSGIVLRGGKPAGGLPMTATPTETGNMVAVTSDQLGRFRLEGLEPGVYRLVVQGSGRGFLPAHEQEVTVDGDTAVEIRLRTVRLSGTVSAFGSGAPIQNAEISLIFETGPGGLPSAV
ncbi:MAG: carboxypeptidase-like regulatory domain-containing protein, partial [Holophagales bacterium]|nr:carboxypeptidase-like regulatory domain-containing protein [Holophagales bacterium]